MIYKGIKFGMLLQLAIGPMCLMVFNTSATYGVMAGLALVLAIALMDGMYVALSGFGIVTLFNKNSIKVVIKILGSIVLVLFGLNTLLGAFQLSLLPDIKMFTNVTNKSIFIQGLLLTASNPLTIIFWSGVFSSQVIEHNLSKNQLVLFGIGCVLSTIIFLSAVAIGGSILSGFLSLVVIQILNIIVGIILIFFGARLLFRK